ncbi:hypothetical protein NHP190003_10140 [Helicobacter sp. NHP19-003]|uniref:Outer membrane protein n=1 Tax=Helicobacter gastrocanis TaxID=2849641 RepID=A0ABN6I2D0_9HELI|nr:hypothetical protein NHP190003_10140 [Helicobacter sp. NHP19-003]
MLQAQVNFGMFVSTPESAQSIAKALLGNTQGWGVNQILQDLETLDGNFGSTKSRLEGLGQALSQVDTSTPTVPDSLDGGVQTSQIEGDFTSAFNALKNYPQALKDLQSALQNALSPSPAPDPTAPLQNLQQNLQQPLDDIKGILQPTTKNVTSTSQELEQTYNKVNQQVKALEDLYPINGAWTKVSTVKSVDDTLKALDNLAATAKQDAQTLNLSPQAQRDLAKALANLNDLKGVTDTLWGINVNSALVNAVGIAALLKKVGSNYQVARSALEKAQVAAAQTASQVGLLKQVGNIVADLKDLKGMDTEANSAASAVQSINEVLQKYQQQYNGYNSTLKGINTSIKNISQEITQAYNYATGQTKGVDSTLCASADTCLNSAIKALEGITGNQTNQKDVAGLQNIANSLQANTDLTHFNVKALNDTIAKLTSSLTPLQNISTILKDIQAINASSGAGSTATDLSNTIKAIEGVQDALNTIDAKRTTDTTQDRINALDQPSGALGQAANSYGSAMRYLKFLPLQIQSILSGGLFGGPSSGQSRTQNLAYIEGIMSSAASTIQQVYTQYQTAQTAINTAATDTKNFTSLPATISNALNTTMQDLQNYIKTLTGQDITQALQQAKANQSRADSLVQTAFENYKNAANALRNVVDDYSAITNSMLPTAQSNTTSSQQKLAKAQQLIKEIEQALTGYQNALKTTANTPPKPAPTPPPTQPNVHNQPNDPGKVASHNAKADQPLSPDVKVSGTKTSTNDPTPPLPIYNPTPTDTSPTNSSPLQILSNATDPAEQRENAWELYVKTQNQIVESVQAELEAQAKEQGMDLAQTLVNLMAGMQQSVGQNLGQGSENYISAVLIEHYNHFYNAVLDNPNISFYAVQESLNNLIGEVANARQNLFDDLNPDTPLISPKLPPQTAMLLARIDLPKLNLAVDALPVAKSIGAAVKELNILLAYLNTIKADLKQYLNASRQPTAGAPKFITQNLNQSQNGNMYGVNAQMGYKQFFGKQKRWGVRYYGTFSYQHGTFYMSDSLAVDNFVYGAGVDALYNFYESKDGRYTSGVFLGLMLTGSTWLAKGASNYEAYMANLNAHGGHAAMHTTYFQIPLNVGFRTNVSKHNGFEIGLRIPLSTDYYFRGTSTNGDSLDITYKRNISVFFNYVYNF